MPKTATLPSIRVSQELRQKMESVLQENETLSNFIENTVQHEIAYRIAQQEFTDRAMKARNAAIKTDNYVSYDELIGGLKSKLAKAKQARKL